MTMQHHDSQLIFKTADIDGKIYVKPQTGFFHSLRRNLNLVLMALFIGLPFLQYQGKQAILLDVAAQQFHLFAITLFPQDFMALVFVFMVAAFLLFYISARFGRVWCGFTCPQTIWTAIFMWVENKIEGNRQQRIKLDKQPWSLQNITRKLAKHLSWLLIACLTATVFMSYFVPALELYPSLISGHASSLVLGWVLFFTLCTYFNAGLIREKMCQHMCPYARFQSVMVGPTTKVVTYDAARGENRGPRKMKQAKPEPLGDCVNCDLCVQVCPVGIDIRNGFQADCINCGLCIDACDQTMAKFGYKKRLIAFASQSKNDSKFRSLGYLAVMTSIVLFAFIWTDSRTELEMTLIKDRNLMYRQLDSGEIENIYVLEVINKTQQVKQVDLHLQHPQLHISSDPHIQLKPLETRTYSLRLTSAEELKQRFVQFELTAKDQNNSLLLSREGTFMSP